MCGVRLLCPESQQKPINSPGWWEGKFPLFQMPAAEKGGQTSVQRRTPPSPAPSTSHQWGRSFYRQQERATCRSSTVSPDSHLQIGHWWSDQHHLGCFKYSYSLVLGFIWSYFFEASSQNCGNLSCGWCLVIVWLTSSPWCFSIYKTAPTMWLRILSIAPEKELKVLDCAWWLHYYYLVSFDCFPLLLNFSFLWLNIFSD